MELYTKYRENKEKLMFVQELVTFKKKLHWKTHMAIKVVEEV